MDVELTPVRASRHPRDRRRTVPTRSHTIEWSRIDSWQEMRVRDLSANHQATTRTTLERDVCLTGLMTEARVSERTNLDMGEAGDRRSDAPLDVPMEMTRAATPTPRETAVATMSEAKERNKKRKRRSGNEAPATPSDGRSRME